MLDINKRRFWQGISTQTRIVVLSIFIIVGGGILAYWLAMQVVRGRWIESREVAGLASVEDEALEIHEWIGWELGRLNATADFVSMLTGKGVSAQTAVAGIYSPGDSKTTRMALMFVSRSCRIECQTSAERLTSGTSATLMKMTRAWSGEIVDTSLFHKHIVITDGKALLLAIPCLSEGRKFLGTLVAYFSASDSPFGESIGSFEASKGKEMFIADLNGDTLARIGSMLPQLKKKVLNDAMDAKGQTGSFLEHDNVYTFARVPSTTWYVFVRQSAAGLNSEMNHVREAILLIGLASTALMLLFSLWIVKTLTTPVRELVWATRTVTLEKFQPIAQNPSGEVGELIGIFNKIGDALNRSYKKLATLNSLGAALVSDIRENDISDRVVRAVCASTNVAACALFMRNETGELVSKSIAGFEGYAEAQKFAWRNMPAITNVIATRKPVVDNDMDSSNLNLRLPGGHRPVKKIMVVPFLLRDNTGGALAAVNYDDRPDFTELDVELLGTFANQAAVAIQNSYYFRQIEDDLKKIRRLKDELTHSEKMSAIGQLVSGVAHELNNPMGVIMGYAELLENGISNDKTAAYATKIWEAAQRASRIVKNLLTFSRKQPHKTELVNLNDVIGSILEILAHPLKLSKIGVLSELQPALRDVTGDRQELQQVFLNLVTNAMQAMDGMDGPQLAIRTFDCGENVRAIVSDNGPGIPVGFHSRIFEPFFTTKPVGKGTGLGLSICYGIITEFHGTMRVESEPGSGASFIIELPAVGESAGGIALSKSAASHRVQGLDVLLVDDENDVREMLANVLRNEGCRVSAAEDAQAALSTLQRIRVDAIITDLHMPEMDGGQFYAVCSERYPEYVGKFIFVSGDTSWDGMQELLAKSGGRLLHKPFVSRELIALLEKIAEGDPQAPATPHNFF